MDHQSIARYFLLQKLPLCFIKNSKNKRFIPLHQYPSPLTSTLSETSRHYYSLHCFHVCTYRHAKKINVVIMKFMCFTFSPLACNTRELTQGNYQILPHDYIKTLSAAIQSFQESKLLRGSHSHIFYGK